jgi:glycogen operon protein
VKTAGAKGDPKHAATGGSPFAVADGAPEPLGVTLADRGVNVAVASRDAERIDFCLFDDRDAEIARLPLARIDDDVHAAFIPNVGVGSRYGLRADGDYAPDRGLWFDPAKLLVDPYARAIDRAFVYREELGAPRAAAIDTAAMMPKAIVTPPAMPAAPAARRAGPGFIYEIAVKAFSRGNPAIPEPLRGTVAALAHPATLDHLVAIGVDTVELMPLAAWIDERHLPPLGLSNAWGYNPVAFMVPEPRLLPGGIDDLRAAVTALHGAGIGVILDVVYNHTGESDRQGPTLSLRGLDNRTYYRHLPDDHGRLVNDTGTGNTLATERPRVVRLVIDAMRHWAEASGIDGFRLDLAATLGRGHDGFRSDAPLFQAIEADPRLSQLTFIAEPWDVGHGGYQLGRMPARWLEWNDRYRDDVRRFWGGGAGALGALATRLSGSSDVFAGRSPVSSVNFLAAHDGFALADLVAHAGKHNHANGEENHDGSNANFSWNSGHEGPTDDPEIAAARRNDVRALLATLFVSQGSPMLTAGDEFGRTQGGNNNAYAQDNATTWLDWPGRDPKLAEFTGRLARLRRKHRSLSDDRFLTGAPLDETGIPDAEWLAPGGRTMTVDDWEHGPATVGLVRYVGGDGLPADRTAVWINAEATAAPAWLPPPRAGRRWMRTIDTSLPEAAPAFVANAAPEVAPRSVAVFVETAE